MFPIKRFCCIKVLFSIGAFHSILYVAERKFQKPFTLKLRSYLLQPNCFYVRLKFTVKLMYYAVLIQSEKNLRLTATKTMPLRRGHQKISIFQHIIFMFKSL